MKANEPREPLAVPEEERHRLAEVLRMVKEIAGLLKTLETSESFSEANDAFSWLQIRWAVASVESRTRAEQRELEGSQ